MPAATSVRSKRLVQYKLVQYKLVQYKAAIGQGADVAFVSAWINGATADISQARLDLPTADGAMPQEMSREELERVMRDMSLVVSRLAEADPA